MAKLEDIWQNLEKKRHTDYDFLPHYMGAENKNENIKSA